MKDDSTAPILYGVSHLDGVTPIQIKFGADREMMTDTVTTIEFDPEVNAQLVAQNIPLAKATASDESGEIRPWVVNASTGAVLIDEL